MLCNCNQFLISGFYNWASFSAQSRSGGTEKAVKSVFQKLGAEAWGHSVADLLQELPEPYKVNEELMNAALELDKAYIPTRYTKEEARRLIEHAEKIFKFCSDLLSQI
ncbi:MAG: HEPN domain-containing protein [Bacteroidota bacterium]|nr:HEPN domain-containing protein [Bacteroidota bacterium]